jgi:hypothetical protein
MVDFDEATHTYLVDGQVKSSVTQMMKGAGLGDYDGLDDYYRDRGTRVHEACDELARGVLRWDKVQSDILPYVHSFEGLVWSLGLSYVSSEQPCYYAEYQCDECGAVFGKEALNSEGEWMCCDGIVSLLYDYCGKYDLIMMWEGKRTLVELKTSKVEMFHGIQVAAYENMVEVDDVLAIELKTGYVFGKADDWYLNHEAWRDICTGRFDLDVWKGDRGRRRMRRII